MASYISWDFSCTDCGEVDTRMMDRKFQEEVQLCECGGEMERIFTPVNVTRKSYIDGTKRFEGHKERHQLRKAKAAARQQGDIASEKKLNTEITKVVK